MYVYIRIDTNNFEIGRAADDALARNDKQQTGRRFASKMDGIEASAQRMVVYARIYIMVCLNLNASLALGVCSQALSYTNSRVH